MEFTYNNNYQATIGMTPYELHWDEVGERAVLGPDILAHTVSLVAKIRDRIQAAQSCLKCYVDQWRRDLVFEVGGPHFPYGVIDEGNDEIWEKGKSQSKYIGPFEILD